MSDFHHNHKWNKVRNRIIKNARGLCANPFGFHSSENMIGGVQFHAAEDVHHIIPVNGTENPNLLYGQNNLIALCKKCHAHAHKLIDNNYHQYKAIFNIQDNNKCQRLNNGKIFCQRQRSERTTICRHCKQPTKERTTQCQQQ